MKRHKLISIGQMIVKGSILSMHQIKRSIYLTVKSKRKWKRLNAVITNFLNSWQMLQVDPKRRITVTQLMSHPWLMDGYESPVKWQSKYHTTDLDSTVIDTMAAYKLISPAQVWRPSTLHKIDLKEMVI